MSITFELQDKSGPKPRPASSHFRPQSFWTLPASKFLDKSGPIVTWDKSSLEVFWTCPALKCFGQVRPQNAGTSPALKCQDKSGRETSPACQDKSGLEVLGQVRPRDKSSTLMFLGFCVPLSDIGSNFVKTQIKQTECQMKAQILEISDLENFCTSHYIKSP